MIYGLPTDQLFSVKVLIEYEKNFIAPQSSWNDYENGSL